MRNCFCYQAATILAPRARSLSPTSAISLPWRRVRSGEQGFSPAWRTPTPSAANRTRASVISSPRSEWAMSWRVSHSCQRCRMPRWVSTTPRMHQWLGKVRQENSDLIEIEHARVLDRLRRHQDDIHERMVLSSIPASECVSRRDSANACGSVSAFSIDRFGDQSTSLRSAPPT